MDFSLFSCSKFGLNCYVYAPKDDDKHRSRWRDFYDQEEFEKLKNPATEILKIIRSIIITTKSKNS